MLCGDFYVPLKPIKYINKYTYAIFIAKNMIKTAETYHVPVLLKESVDGLNIQPGGIYVDVTFGGG